MLLFALDFQCQGSLMQINFPFFQSMNFYILFLFKKRLTVLSLSRVEHKSKFQVKKRVPQFIIAVTLRTSDDINGHLIRMRCKHIKQCFSTFFDSRHPYVATELFGGTPG